MQIKEQATPLNNAWEHHHADLGEGPAAVKSFWNSLSMADRQKLLTVRISDLADRARKQTRSQKKRLDLGVPLGIFGLYLYFPHGIHTQRQGRAG